MRDDYTHITVVLDASGSMSGSKKTAAISGVNEIVSEYESMPGKATLSLYRFNGFITDNVRAKVTDNPRVVRVRDFVEVSDDALVDESAFTCEGLTPLHDAMATAIDETGDALADTDESERPGKVIVVCVTDGIENASKDEDARTVRERVEHQHNVYGWEFLYVGANQDAVLTAERMGLSADNAMTYTDDASGMRSAMSATLSAATSYSATGKMSGYKGEDRKDA